MAEDWSEDFRTYLPNYLSAPATDDLFRELKQFPENIDSRLYTRALRETANLFQGDGLSDVWVSDKPGGKVAKSRVMVVSNICDIAAENE